LDVIYFRCRPIITMLLGWFGSRSKRDFAIYAGSMRRELRDFFVFEDIGKLGVFGGNRSRNSGSNGRYGFEGNRSRSSGGCGCGRNVVRGSIRIEVDRGGESFLVASNVSDCEKEKFVVLWIDLTGRKDSRETTFRLGIRRIRRIW